MCSECITAAAHIMLPVLQENLYRKVHRPSEIGIQYNTPLYKGRIYKVQIIAFLNLQEEDNLSTKDETPESTLSPMRPLLRGYTVPCKKVRELCRTCTSPSPLPPPTVLTLSVCLVQHPPQPGHLRGQLHDTRVEECRAVPVAGRGRGCGTQSGLQLSV